jgi:hypothetical protein
MTLILNAVVGDYAVQVSDRRLTLPNGTVYTDDANKAVLFCSRMAFACTGLGRIGEHSTDHWLMQALVNARTASLSEALHSLAAQGTARLRKLGLPKVYKRLAFAGIGWALLPEAEFLSPVICSVSNAQADDWSWLHEATDEFRVRYNIGPQLPASNIISAGVPLPQGELTTVRRHLRRCLARGTGPEPVARLLVKEIRRIAGMHGTVGKNLMVTCLPAQSVFAAEHPTLTNLAPSAPFTMRDNPSFYHVSATDRDVVTYGPNLVGCGVGYRDWKAERLNETGSDASIEVTIVRPKDWPGS